jgi:antitoxin (DNA-binding transcriptional repressor) of toxin-antitoxin stability system
MTEPGFVVRAEDQPAWAEIVRRAERGESVAVIAHGEHVADVVPSGELDRLHETIEVLSDTDLVRDLREGLADARAGRVFSAERVAADLAARRAAGPPTNERAGAVHGYVHPCGPAPAGQAAAICCGRTVRALDRPGGREPTPAKDL